MARKDRWDEKPKRKKPKEPCRSRSKIKSRLRNIDLDNWEELSENSKRKDTDTRND